MKKLKMIVTSVIVLAIVGSAFAFNAKKNIKFCYATTSGGTCVVSDPNLQRVTSGGDTKYYLPDWDGNAVHCTSSTGCTVEAQFVQD